MRGGGSAGGSTGVSEQDGVGLGDGGAGVGPGESQGPVGDWGCCIRDVASAAGWVGVGWNVLRPGRAAGYDSLAAGTDLDRSALSGQRSSP